jgi:hypothetical protein
MSELRTFADVLVSSTAFDFKGRAYHDVPRAVLADWASLMASLAGLLHPGFAAPTLPETFQFSQEMITSDGPYGSDENYYMLSYFYLDLTDAKGVGLRIAFERGRQGGEEPLGIETRGVQPQISSYIDEGARSPRARIYVFLEDAQTGPVQQLISAHAARCARGKS